jgi:hypothetical protein
MVSTPAPQRVDDEIQNEKENAGVEPGGAVDEVLHRPGGRGRLELGREHHDQHEQEHEHDAELDRRHEAPDAMKSVHGLSLFGAVEGRDFPGTCEYRDTSFGEQGDPGLS